MSQAQRMAVLATTTVSFDPVHRPGAQYAHIEAELTPESPVAGRRSGATGNAPLYNEVRTTTWLAWLAYQMRRRNLALFQIENLQPDWLAGYKETLPYLLLTRTIWSLLAWTLLGLTNWISSGMSSGLSLGLVIGLVFGLPQGVLWGLLEQVARRYKFANFLPMHGQSNWLLIAGALIGGLLNGLLFGLVGWLLRGELSERAVGILCIFGFSGGLLLGLIETARVTLREQTALIRTVETVRWSWHCAGSNAPKGLLFGLIGGVSMGLIAGQFYAISEDPMFGLMMGLGAGMRVVLVTGPIGGLLGGVIGGFQPIAQERKTRPNQGIWLTLWSSIKFSLPAGIGVGLLLWWLLAPAIGVAAGVVTALCIGSWYGGLDVVEHGIVRLIIAWRGYAPLNYARFLTYAAEELQILQKVGGGYVFAKDNQLAHFAQIAVEKGYVTPTAR